MKIESAEEFAETMKACASEFLGGVEWDHPFAIACVQARDRAVAKKVLEGLERDLNVCLTGENGYAPLNAVLRPGWKAAADAMRAYRVNPAEFARLMKE